MYTGESVRTIRNLLRLTPSYVLCLVVLDVLASVEASQVVSQLPCKYGVETVSAALHQVSAQPEDQVLGHGLQPGFCDGRSCSTTHGRQLSQMIVLFGVVQLVGMDENQVGVLNTLKLHSGFTCTQSPQTAQLLYTSWTKPRTQQKYRSS